MLKIALMTSLVTLIASCGLQNRDRPVKINRPDRSAPEKPESKTPTDPQITPEGPETAEKEPETSIDPIRPAIDPDDRPLGKIEAYSSSHLTVTAGPESTSTLTFTGDDARIIYKTMAISRTTVTPTAAKYHYVKRGKHLACERFVMASDLTTANYRCTLGLVSTSGAALELNGDVVAGAPDESLTASYAGELVSMVPSNTETVGVITIRGNDGATTFKNLQVDENASKKLGEKLSCEKTTSDTVCVLKFRYDLGMLSDAN